MNNTLNERVSNIERLLSENYPQLQHKVNHGKCHKSPYKVTLHNGDKMRIVEYNPMDVIGVLYSKIDEFLEVV